MSTKFRGQGVVGNIVCYSCGAARGLESVCGHWVGELLHACDRWMFPWSQDGLAVRNGKMSKASLAKRYQSCSLQH